MTVSQDQERSRRRKQNAVYEDNQIEKDYDFTNSDGSKSKVTMLRETVNSYFGNEDFLGFTKAYKDSNYKFFAIVPTGDLTPMDVLEKFKANGESLPGLIRDYTERGEAITRIPKFTMDYDIELNDVLKKIGVRTAFTSGADFSNLTDSGSLAINKVLHKTHFELDEKGVKAAAATSISMLKTAVAPQKTVNITLDRPFIYGIYSTQSNIPLFIGVQNSFN